MKLATNKKSLLSVLLLSLLSSFPQAAAKTKKKEEGKTKIHPKFGKALDPDALLAGITVGGGSSKILNGENATVGDYPWFTMNLFRYEGSIYLAGCGASLIAPGWVLTAAHCIGDYFAADPLVLIGALSPYETGNGGQFSEIIEVESVYSHPNYGVGGFLNNDFALLKLQTESTITPVDFDIAGVSKTYSTGYGNLYAAGFGVTSTGGSSSDKLMEVNLQYISNDNCMGGPSGDYQFNPGQITNEMMCAGDNDFGNSLVEALCQGDSGGPLYDASNNMVVGVVSWLWYIEDVDGNKCADFPQFPPVFARVSAGSNWIQQITGITAPTHAPTAPTPTAPTPTAPTPTVPTPTAPTPTAPTPTAPTPTAPTHAPTAPTPTAPTPTAPTPTAPTPTPPTSKCKFDEMTVQVYLTTDSYPYENSWTIVSSTGAIVESGTFNNAHTTYSGSLCMDKTICHTFTLLDSYGDGIFSPGDFSLIVDGSEILYNPNGSFDSLSVEFGTCSGSPTPPTPPAPSPTTPTPPTPTPPAPSPTAGSTKIESLLTNPGFCLENRASDNIFILNDCSSSTTNLLIPAVNTLGSVQIDDSNNLCMALSTISNRSLVVAKTCDSQSSSQKWIFNTNGEIRSGANQAYCLDDNGSYEEVNIYQCDDTLDQYWTSTRDSWSWVQIGGTIEGESEYDRAGRSVALSADGNYLAVGAPYDDGNGNNSGHVRVYRNMNGSWIQIGQDIDGEDSYNYAGWSVALSDDGKELAVGAKDNNDNGSNSGHVRVYRNVNGSWTQIGQDIDGESMYDYLGSNVALSASGNVLAVAAPEHDGDNGANSGHVKIYQNLNGTYWVQIGDDIEGDSSYDELGQGLALSGDGNVIAVGAPDGDGNGSNSGRVRVYQNVNGTWNQIGDDIDGESGNDESGFGLAISYDGSVLAVGAPYNDDNGNNSGHVKVYQNVNGTWVQIGADIEGEGANDRIGLSQSIALSADGNVLAVGGPYNDDNGNNSGHVRVYQNENGSWNQVGEDINGESALDYFGTSIALSSDGSVLAIGGPWNSDNVSEAGHVRVYQWVGNLF